MLRVRDTAASAIRDFFHQNGFVELHTPILTSSDCEGCFLLLPFSSKVSDRVYLPQALASSSLSPRCSPLPKTGKEVGPSSTLLLCCKRKRS